MKPTEDIYGKCAGFAEFAKGYFRHLGELLDRLDTGALTRFVEELEKARDQGNTIFLAGNGGSAATASHMANDLATDVLRKGKSPKPFKVWALTESVACLTAIANDENFDNVFVNQLKVHLRPGDKLVVISGSGNSPNVVAAARWTRNNGGAVLGLLGFDGGELLGLCDVAVVVETAKGDYGPVEDIHLIIDHLCSNWLIYQSCSQARR
jgi:D-sedoheptulose 7-phosphate isomerase